MAFAEIMGREHGQGAATLTSIDRPARTRGQGSQSRDSKDERSRFVVSLIFGTSLTKSERADGLLAIWENYWGPIVQTGSPWKPGKDTSGLGPVNLTGEHSSDAARCRSRDSRRTTDEIAPGCSQRARSQIERWRTAEQMRSQRRVAIGAFTSAAGIACACDANKLRGGGAMIGPRP